MKYNPLSLESILNYAYKLKDKSLRDVCGKEIELNTYKGKGNFGQILEKYYFEYNPNSNSEPDFKEVGLELKSSPLKKVRKVEFNAKERLVLNIINYFEVPNQKFETSSFFKKNYHLLLIFYLHESDVELLDFVIKIIGEWKIPPTDLKIIKKDWETITEKIRNGQAHELSEGDTFYLGACTKGGKGGNFREQPYSSTNAKQRAYSFKQGYLNHIIASLNKDVSKTYGKLIHSEKELQRKSIQEIVIERFLPYLNKPIDTILQELDILDLNKKSKSFFYSLTKKILGISLDKEIEEFEKAGITIKTIRIKVNNLPKENMSFPSFNYIELVKEEWDDSPFKEILESKFLFVFFKFDVSGILRLDKVKFWNMSHSDIQEAKKVWDQTKKVVKNGNIVKEVVNNIRHTNFPDMSFNRISHVRPHATVSSDTYPLPIKDIVTQKMEYTKHSFWLNNSYIRDEIYLK